MRSGRRRARGASGTVIAELVGLYGVVLVVVGLLDDDPAAGSGGVDGDLWTGVAMVVAAAAFAVWSRLHRSAGDPASPDEQEGR